MDKEKLKQNIVKAFNETVEKCVVCNNEINKEEYENGVRILERDMPKRSVKRSLN